MNVLCIGSYSLLQINYKCSYLYSNFKYELPFFSFIFTYRYTLLFSFLSANKILKYLIKSMDRYSGNIFNIIIYFNNDTRLSFTKIFINYNLIRSMLSKSLIDEFLIFTPLFLMTSLYKNQNSAICISPYYSLLFYSLRKY